MPVEKVDTLVVGGGQAGLAMSEHLSACGVPHLVLERHRIAERWRSERWDSLVANGPAWHDRFPGMEFSGTAPEAFAPKEKVADYFVAYAKMIAAPVRCGVEVQKVQRNLGRPGFRVETSNGDIEADNVVVATGPFQRPVIPGHRSRRRRHLPDPLQRLSQSRPAPERRGAGGRCGVLWSADRRRAFARGKTRLPVGRPARSHPARLSRARLLLVARNPGQVGRRNPRPRHRARHDRGERRLWRPDHRFPAPRRARG